MMLIKFAAIVSEIFGHHVKSVQSQGLKDIVHASRVVKHASSVRFTALRSTSLKSDGLKASLESHSKPSPESSANHHKPDLPDRRTSDSMKADGIELFRNLLLTTMDVVHILHGRLVCTSRNCRSHQEALENSILSSVSPSDRPPVPVVSVDSVITPAHKVLFISPESSCPTLPPCSPDIMAILHPELAEEPPRLPVPVKKPWAPYVIHIKSLFTEASSCALSQTVYNALIDALKKHSDVCEHTWIHVAWFTYYALVMVYMSSFAAGINSWDPWPDFILLKGRDFSERSASIERYTSYEDADGLNSDQGSQDKLFGAGGHRRVIGTILQTLNSSFQSLKAPFRSVKMGLESVSDASTVSRRQHRRPTNQTTATAFSALEGPRYPDSVRSSSRSDGETSNLGAYSGPNEYWSLELLWILLITDRLYVELIDLQCQVQYCNKSSCISSISSEILLAHANRAVTKVADFIVRWSCTVKRLLHEAHRQENETLCSQISRRTNRLACRTLLSKSDLFTEEKELLEAQLAEVGVDKTSPLKVYAFIEAFKSSCFFGPIMSDSLVKSIHNSTEMMEALRLIRLSHSIISIAFGYYGLPQSTNKILKPLSRYVASTKRCDARDLSTHDIYGLHVCQLLYESGIDRAIGVLKEKLMQHMINLQHDVSAAFLEKGKKNRGIWDQGFPMSTINLLYAIDTYFKSSSFDKRSARPSPTWLVYQTVSDWLMTDMRQATESERERKLSIPPGMLIKFILIAEADSLLTTVLLGTQLWASIFSRDIAMDRKYEQVIFSPTDPLDDDNLSLISQSKLEINTMGYYTHCLSHLKNVMLQAYGCESLKLINTRTLNDSLTVMLRGVSTRNHVQSDSWHSLEYSSDVEDLPGVYLAAGALFRGSACCCQQYGDKIYADQFCGFINLWKSRTAIKSRGWINTSTARQHDLEAIIRTEDEKDPALCCNPSMLTVVDVLNYYLFYTSDLGFLSNESYRFIASQLPVLWEIPDLPKSCVIKARLAQLLIRVAIRIDTETQAAVNDHVLSYSYRDKADTSLPPRSTDAVDRDRIISEVDRLIDDLVIPACEAPETLQIACFYLVPLLNAPSLWKAKHAKQINALFSYLHDVAASADQYASDTIIDILTCLSPHTGPNHFNIFKRVITATDDLQVAAFTVSMVSSTLFLDRYFDQQLPSYPNFVSDWCTTILHLFQCSSELLARYGFQGTSASTPADAMKKILPRAAHPLIQSAVLQDQRSVAGPSADFICEWVRNICVHAICDELIHGEVLNVDLTTMENLWSMCPPILRALFMVSPVFWELRNSHEKAYDVFSELCPFKNCDLDCIIPLGAPPILCWNATYWQTLLSIRDHKLEDYVPQTQYVIFFDDRYTRESHSSECGDEYYNSERHEAARSLKLKSVEDCKIPWKCSKNVEWERRAMGRTALDQIAFVPMVSKSVFILVQFLIDKSHLPPNTIKIPVMCTCLQFTPELICRHIRRDQRQRCTEIAPRDCLWKKEMEHTAIFIKWNYMQRNRVPIIAEQRKSGSLYSERLSYAYDTKTTQSLYVWLLCACVLNGEIFDITNLKDNDQIRLCVGVNGSDRFGMCMFIDQYGEITQDPVYCSIKLKELRRCTSMGTSTTKCARPIPFDISLSSINGRLYMVGVSFLLKQYFRADQNTRSWAKKACQKVKSQTKRATYFRELWSKIDRGLITTRTGGDCINLLYGDHCIGSSLVPSTSLLGQMARIPKGLSYIQAALQPLRQESGRHLLNRIGVTRNLIGLAIDVGGIWEPDSQSLRILGDVYGPLCNVYSDEATTLMFYYLGRTPSLLSRHVRIVGDVTSIGIEFTDYAMLYSSINLEKMHLLFNAVKNLSILNLHRNLCSDDPNYSVRLMSRDSLSALSMKDTCEYTTETSSRARTLSYGYKATDVAKSEIVLPKNRDRESMTTRLSNSRRLSKPIVPPSWFWMMDNLLSDEDEGQDSIAPQLPLTRQSKAWSLYVPGPEGFELSTDLATNGDSDRFDTHMSTTEHQSSLPAPQLPPEFCVSAVIDEGSIDNSIGSNTVYKGPYNSAMSILSGEDIEQVRPTNEKTISHCELNCCHSAELAALWRLLENYETCSPLLAYDKRHMTVIDKLNLGNGMSTGNIKVCFQMLQEDPQIADSLELWVRFEMLPDSTDRDVRVAFNALKGWCARRMQQSTPYLRSQLLRALQTVIRCVATRLEDA